MEGGKHRFDRTSSVRSKSAFEHDENDYSRSSSEDPVLQERPLGIISWVTCLTLLCIVCLFVVNINEVCRPSTASSNNSTLTIDAVAARQHLRVVTGFGQRMAGSISNEIYARQYLVNELNQIVDVATSAGLVASVSDHSSKTSSFRTHPHISSYSNVRNIAFRLHNPNSSLSGSNKAILVNCHYDSSIGSPGASDAFVSCAVMLESARVLANNVVPLTNDIIFLFNGAEESLLLASHAFVSESEWMKDITLFINLEGAGIGGRMIVFQTGPGQGTQNLMNAYSLSFHQPHGNVFGEEMFQLGLIPADTDFRVFRDYGLIPGIDMAYVSNGYAYHTKYDNEARIRQNCLQQAGDNIVTFLATLAKDETIRDLSPLIPVVSTARAPHDYNETSVQGNSMSFHDLPAAVPSSKSSRYVYFDFLGYYMVTWPWWQWCVFEFVSLSCFIVWVIRVRIHKQGEISEGSFSGFLLAGLFHIIWVLSGAAFAIFLGLITHNYGCRMSWYSTRYNLFGIYFLPNIWFIVVVYTWLFRIPNSHLFKIPFLNKLLSDSGWGTTDGELDFVRIERDHFDAGIAMLFAVMLCIVMAGSPSSYLFTISAIIPLFFRLLFRAFTGNRRYPPSLASLLITTLPCITIMHSYLVSSLFEFLIPITGRAGQVMKPDIVIAGLSFFVISAAGPYFGGYLQTTSVKHAKWMRFFLLNACLSYALLVHASAYGFPYTVDTVDVTNINGSPRYQRVCLIHTNRDFRDTTDSDVITSSDSGIILIPLDANGIRYLTPNAFPLPASSSLFAAFRPTPTGPGDYGGLVELVGAQRFSCETERPYCGLASIMPLAHAFSDYYYLPKARHTATPGVRLEVVSRQPVPPNRLPEAARASYPSGGRQRAAFNLTLAVTAGPPHTHVFIRTSAPRVRLLDWSFAREAGPPNTVALPDDVPGNKPSGPVGAHYFIFHLNAAAHEARPSWQQPLVFWLVVDVEIDGETPTVGRYFDVSLMGAYFDQDMESGNTVELTDLINRLPAWVVPIHTTTTYQHWRIGLQ